MAVSSSQLQSQQLIDQLIGRATSQPAQPIPYGRPLTMPVNMADIQPTGPFSTFPPTQVAAPGLRVAGPAASSIDDLAAQVAAGGGIKSKAAGLLGANANKISSSKLFGKFPKGLAGRGGIGIGLSYGGNILGDLAGGNESLLGRTIKGAGTGGGIGAFGGPWGALGGGVIGGVAGALGLLGGGKEGGGAKIEDLISNAPISDDARSQLKVVYDILKETTDEDTAKTKIGEMILNEMTMGKAQAQSEADAQARMLATQALTAQFFQPFTKQLLDSAQMRYKATQDLLPSLPESYRGIAQNRNAAVLDDSVRMAHAYAAQSQLIPTMAAMQQQQAGVNQIAQQLFQQSLAQTGAMGGDAGGGSIADLIAQQVPTG